MKRERIYQRLLELGTFGKEKGHRSWRQLTQEEKELIWDLTPPTAQRAMLLKVVRREMAKGATIPREVVRAVTIAVPAQRKLKR